MTQSTLKSRGTIAAKAGAAAVLICTGVVFGCWTLFVDAIEMIYGQPFGFPDSRFIGMIVTGLVFPIFLIGVIAVTFLLTLKRCTRMADGFIAGCAALYLMLIVPCFGFISRKIFDIYYLLPAVTLGKLTDSSAGWYLGVVIQFFLAAWLLDGFRQFKPKQTGI